MKQYEIKSLISDGIAIDLTNCAMNLEFKSQLRILAVSHGKNGMNGALLQDRYTGQLYGITARNAELFYYV